MNVIHLYRHSIHYDYTITYSADRGKQMFMKEAGYQWSLSII